MSVKACTVIENNQNSVSDSISGHTFISVILKIVSLTLIAMAPPKTLLINSGTRTGYSFGVLCTLVA